MATSPIYSWPEPDNTDLVKNGALAIRTLGNAIDTTMGTMVAKTVVDAKGDLIAGTAADTVNRLAVGANGETLVADSSTSTGLKWAKAGKVLQVVMGTVATQVSNASSTHYDTGLSATITPSSTSSKVLVLVAQTGTAKTNTDTSVDMYLVRGSTNIIRFTHYEGANNALNLNTGVASTHYLDSPATTSATTYKTTFASRANTAEVYVQIAGAASSTIILMEIGA